MSHKSPHLAPFLSVLFDDDEAFDLGSVGRIGIQDSKYAVNTIRLIKSLVDNALEPEAFAEELLLELGKCAKFSSLGQSFNDLNKASVIDRLKVSNLKSGTFAYEPEDWANSVKSLCTQPMEELDNVRKLAARYLTHLLFPSNYVSLFFIYP